MALYRYKAKTAEGKSAKGRMEAADEAELYGKLREQGQYLVSCSEVSNKQRSQKIKAKPLGEFCRSLGTLLKAGVSLVRALAIICQEENIKPQHKLIYENVLRLVRQGTVMSEAMEEQGEAFPPLLIHMIRSAEASGSLDKVTLRMADHYEKEYKLHSKVTNAMIYPCILLVLIVVVVVFIFTFVIPQFQSLFDQMDSLPVPTQIMQAISSAITNHWLLILIILAVVVMGITFILRIPAVRLQLDKLKVHMPGFGKLLKIVYTARFARTLSSLYSAGIPIVGALQICRNIVGNKYIEMQFDEAIAKVRTGENLSAVIQNIDGFTNKLASSVMVGEETGSLDSMLDSIADTLDYESEMAINKMVTLMEPILIVIMAVIVAFIMISVLMPIYGSYEAIENSAN
ncbi:MAG: type II secretion system F family protein [Blautia sp.]|jgi:type IV pilus assembly protein PilC